MQSSSLPEAAALGDSILRILWEGNEETFAAAKNAIMQRVLVATAQAAFEDLGSPDAIARQALEHPKTDHAVVRSAASALTDLLIEDVARRSMDDLADPAAAAHQAREHIEKDHQAVVVAKNLLKVHLLDEIAQGATDGLADPKAVAHEARQRIEEEEETLINGRKALIERLLVEIADRSTEAIADAQQAAVQARKHIDDEPVGGAVAELKERLLVEIAARSTEAIADAQQAAVQARKHIDDEPIGGAVAELKERLVAEIADRSVDDLADLASTVDKALALVGDDHHVVLRAVDRLKEEILQTVVQQALAKISDEVSTPLAAEIADRSTEAIADAQQAAVQARKHIDDEPIGGAVVEEFFQPKLVRKSYVKTQVVGERPPAPPTRTEAPETPSSTPKMQRRKAANGYPEQQEIPPEAAPSAHLAQAHYIHGIVAHRGLVEALAAVDSETVYRPYVIPFKTLAAVASRVPGALTENDGWKALKGVQAGLLEHLGQKGAAVLPMYAETLYASEADLVATLAAHAQTLEVHLGELSGKQEWAVKIYCDPERIKQEMHSTDASIDAFLGQILVDVHEWGAQGPAEELKAIQDGMDLSLAELLETVQLNCQQSVHRALQGVSEDSRLASSSEEPVFSQSRLVLNASYLVAESEDEAFRAELERLAAEYERVGLVYYVGGPHSPCRFTAPGAPEL